MLLNVIIVFFYIYCVQFKGIPLSTSKWIVVLLGGYSFLFKRDSIIYFFRSRIARVSLVIFSFLLFFSFAVPMVMGTGDFHIAYSVLLFIVEDFLGCFFLFLFLNRKGNLTLKIFFDIYSNAAFVQSIIMLAMLFLPGVRTFFWKIQETDFSTISERYAGVRGMGLATSVTYDLGVVLSLALIFIAFNVTERNFRNIKFDLFKYALTLMAAALAGRTGLIGFALSLLYILHNTIKKNEFFVLVRFFFILVLFSISSLYAYIEFVPIKTRMNIEAYVFESLFNYQQTGRFHSYSGDTLKNMYFAIPWDTFWLGDGKYTENGHYYMKTDAGYMRNILFWGIFPSLLLYSLYVFWICSSLSNKRNQQAVYLLWMLLLYYFIVNYKGDFLLGCRMATKVFISVVFVLKFGRAENACKPQSIRNNVRL